MNVPTSGADRSGSGSLLRGAVLVALLGALGAASGTASGCVRERGPVTVRPSRPLDEGLAEEWAPREAGRSLVLELIETGAAHRRFGMRFELWSEAEGDYRTITGDLYAASAAGPFSASSRAALIVVSPILAGPVDDYLACRFVCRSACDRGMSAFFLHQEKVILDPGRDAVALEARIRENLRANRAALDLLGRLPGVDEERLGSFGISLGGVKNVALIASEPRLRANAICLAGSDLSAMLLASRERLVARYLEGRWRRDGLPAEAVASELERQLVSEPGAVAPSIDPRRVLLVLARFDDKVPYAAGRRLHEALGRPETLVLPTGHYTAVLLAPWAVGRALDWLDARLAARARTAAEGVASTRPGAGNSREFCWARSAASLR